MQTGTETVPTALGTGQLGRDCLEIALVPETDGVTPRRQTGPTILLDLASSSPFSGGHLILRMGIASDERFPDGQLKLLLTIETGHPTPDPCRSGPFFVLVF